MAKLKSSRTGIVIDVPDSTAANLSAEWKPVKAKAPAKATDDAQDADTATGK